MYISPELKITGVHLRFWRTHDSWRTETQLILLTDSDTLLVMSDARSGGGSHPMGAGPGCVYWKFRVTGLSG